MNLERLDSAGHRWRINGRDLDLRVDSDSDDPALVRAFVLVTRDGSGVDDEDIAAVIEWAIDGHPPAGWGCGPCDTTTACPTQRGAHQLAFEFLTRRAAALVASMDARLHALAGRRAA